MRGGRNPPQSPRPSGTHDCPHPIHFLKVSVGYAVHTMVFWLAPTEALPSVLLALGVNRGTTTLFYRIR